MPSPTGLLKDTAWRVPYKSWTLADLLIANYLRADPLSISDVCRFQQHLPSSARQTRSNLRSTGRLTPEHTVNQDHPLFLAVVGTPKARPLPDPGTRPLSTRTAAHQAAVSTALREHDPDGPSPSKLTRERASAILAELITSGQAGENIHRYIDTWLQTAPIGSSAPREPLTDTQIHDRLLTLLCAAPESAVRRVIASWEERLLAHPASPGSPPSGHVGPDPPEEGQTS